MIKMNKVRGDLIDVSAKTATLTLMQSIPGVPKLTNEYNPATWMLEVCGGAAKMYVDSVQADFHDIYRNSKQFHQTADTADAIASADKKAHSPLTMSSRYATSRTKQVWP